MEDPTMTPLRFHVALGGCFRSDFEDTAPGEFIPEPCPPSFFIGFRVCLVGRFKTRLLDQRPG
jgi:hypothetical protein